MARYSNTPWTVEDDQQLRDMALDGKSVPAISAQLNRTIGAVICRAHSLGLSAAIDKTVRDQRHRRESDRTRPEPTRREGESFNPDRKDHHWEIYELRFTDS
jgi:hypothetical protein